MPRVTHVKSARKARPEHGIAVGDSYFWWAFRLKPRGSLKRYSKTYPKQSQLTLSEYLSTALALGERWEAFEHKDDAASAAEELNDIASEFEGLGSEQRDKFDNLPEGLQQGSTGELLEERADKCEEITSSLQEAASELESIDEDEIRTEAKEEVKADHEDDEPDDRPSAEDLESEIQEKFEEKLQEKVEEHTDDLDMEPE